MSGIASEAVDTVKAVFDPRKQIYALLREIEAENSVTVVFAVIGGSRACHMETETSDYDVRFVYIQNNTIDNFMETKDEKSIVKKCGDDFEFMGWSLCESIEMVKRSNSTIMECIFSDLVLINSHRSVNELDFQRTFRPILRKIHNKVSLVHHYSCMAETNFRTFIAGKPEVICKKYMYIARPILMVKYIFLCADHAHEESGSGNGGGGAPVDPIVMDFNRLFEKVKHTLAPEVAEEIDRVVTLKKQRVIKIPHSEILNKWISAELFEIDKFKQKTGSKKKQPTLTGRAIASSYSTLKNETKKILDISQSHPTMSVNNYKSAIFAFLKYLWVKNNMDRNVNEMTKDLYLLFDETKQFVEDEEIVQLMDRMINYREFEENAQSKLAKEVIGKNLLDPIVKMYDPKYKVDLENIRREVYDYLARNAVHVMHLVIDPKASPKDPPQTVFNRKGSVKDPELRKFFEHMSKMLKGMKSVGTVDVDEKLNAWMRTFVGKEEAFVNEYQRKISNIKQENAILRLKSSMTKIDRQVFKDILSEALL